MKKSPALNRRGFSLIETLVVCGLWALMLGITLSAIFGIVRAVGHLAGTAPQ